MMQRSSVLCSYASNLLPSSTLPSHAVRQFASRGQSRRPPVVSAPSPPSRLPVPGLQCRGTAFSPPRSNATQEIVETNLTEAGYIEVGYISRAHGLQGEICVKPTTEFPELRFCKPGSRWLKQRVSGRHMIQEMELVDGRGHPGQKSWILKFEGIDTVEQAEQLIGSTILVMERDRPDLDEGEYYTRDLVGMRVIHKETAEVIGTVASVYDSGANDLLHVRLESAVHGLDVSGKSKEEVGGASDRLIWVPFVEAIVPDVDINRREMFIRPPKGLLELNLRSDTTSKKERRQLVRYCCEGFGVAAKIDQEWKERKRFQKRLIAAKKKLVELEQQHVFHGFQHGDKTQGRLLADQIVSVNSKLLQQALPNIKMSSEIISGAKFINGTMSKIPGAAIEKLGANFAIHENENHLVSVGKLATVLVVNDSDGPDISNLVSEMLVQVEDRGAVPLILISSSDQIKDLERLFLENDYFAFDSKKVWFLEEEMLPIVSSSTEEQKRHKILMKSPWEMLQSPVGSGGIISSLSSQGIPEILIELGVEYLQICSTNRISLSAPELLLGLTKSKKAEIGIQISEDSNYSDETLDMIISMSFLNKLVKQMDKLQFFAIPKAHSHVELVEKEWVDVIPSSPNSYEICSSLYSCLNFCSSDEICLLQITE